jgi:ribosomal protein S24E
VEIRILEEHANPLMKRHEYHFEVAHATAATPTRDAVRGELAKLVKTAKDRVVIERMRARYGTAVTRGDAMVYDTVEVAKSTERAHILVRNGLKEKEAKTPPPAAAEPPKADSGAAPAPTTDAPAPSADAPATPEKKE